MSTWPITPPDDYAVVTEDSRQGAFFSRYGIVGLILLAVIAVAGAVCAYNYFRLPPPFTVGDNTELLAYTNGDLALAIDVAERINLPVHVTRVGGQPVEVSYEDARRLAKSPRFWELDFPMYRGDYVDARRGYFVPNEPDATRLPGVNVYGPPPMPVITPVYPRWK